MRALSVQLSLIFLVFLNKGRDSFTVAKVKR